MKKSELKEIIKEEVRLVKEEIKQLKESAVLKLDDNTRSLLIDALNLFIKSGKYKSGYSIEEINFIKTQILKY